jgi:ADP-ribosyl-[dinitrogen reductase] hydrolase
MSIASSRTELDPRARYRGSLIGLAVGDALGASYEGMPPGSFAPVVDMGGRGLHAIPAGVWTDDTSMALCLAESLVARDGFDLRDQLERYLRWFHDGHLSSTGIAFGMGRTVSMALARFEFTGDPASSGLTEPMSAGNGSIMRVAPVPLFFASDRGQAVEKSGESSKATHRAPAAVDACRYLGALIWGAANESSKDELLDEGFWQNGELVPEIEEVARGSFRRRDPPEIEASGYVVRSLEAALWALDRSDSFREGCLLAVNLGGDTDTTAAVFGQLAGALYGEDAIPDEWRATLARRELVERLADALFTARRDRA